MAAWNPWFPANFIAETTATEMAVMGPEIELPAANKTYYRVVAMDDQGKRSGPSEFATAPRPVIFSRPGVAGQGRFRVPLPGPCQPLARRPQRTHEGRRAGQRLL